MIQKGAWSLGDAVIPEHYVIKIEPNLSTFVFYGQETIHVFVRKSTDRITLNSKNLEILSASATSGGRTYGARLSINKVKEEITLHLLHRVKGKVKIDINFSGRNEDKLYGFYRSSYEYKGKKRYLLTTQFEPNDARSAFPCFDEPVLKATFSLSMAIDRSMSAISNMPIKIESDIDNGKKLVEFDITPKMSSYLLYFSVGNFERITKRLGKIEVGVITVPGRIKQAEMALGFGVKFVEFFQNYFKIRYPLPKIDLIAVPDFAVGAMENWGAITFREVRLLGDEKKSALQAKQSIASVIAHELAHQWFGDLVTMEWWDDLWLNESFATFMACKALDSVFPEWKMDDQYLLEAVSVAMNSDQLISTHPISVNVKNPAEIEQIFDNISYEKGGSVLYMLENYVGLEVFRKGLHNFLSKNSYSNATKTELWGEISAEARKRGIRDVECIAKNWIEMPGYPVVEVSQSKSTLDLVQNRLTLSTALKSDAWPIPLSYKMQDGSKGSILMLKKRLRIKIGGNKWVKLNQSQLGFYRASYPEDILEGLGKAIRTGIIQDRDAWGVENDLFFFARSARMHVSEYFDFITKYCMVDSQLLNFGVLSHLIWLCTILEGTNMQAKANAAAASYGKAVLGRLTWDSEEDDNPLTVMLRASSISLLGLIRYDEVIKKSKSLFKAFLDKKRAINPDLRLPVYVNVVRSDPDRTYSAMKQLYLRADDPEAKKLFLMAIGAASDKAHARDVMSFSISKSVRLQDSLFVLSSEASHPEAHSLLWSWLKQNWKFILRKYPVGMHRRFIELFSSAKDVSICYDMKKFFGVKANAPDEVKRAITQTLERIQANISFIKKNEA